MENSAPCIHQNLATEVTHLIPYDYTRWDFDVSTDVGRKNNFAFVVIDWMLKKIKNFNLSIFSIKDRQRRESMTYNGHLIRIF